MDESEVAAIWYNSALLHYYNNNKAEALKYLERYLSMATTLNGRNHLQVAEGYHRKGQVLYEIKDLDGAMTFLSEALEVRRKKLGDCHPAVADSYFLIGKVLSDKEEYEFSLMSFEKALSIQRALAQDDLSFDVAQTLLEIGRVRHLKGELEESIKVYSEVLDLTKKFFGDVHPFVVRIINILGNLHAETGQTDKSGEYYEEARRIETEQCAMGNQSELQVQ
jgi:tetratricopeptide (TPR) repeat protein